MDRTEFIKVVDFEPQERPDPDALMAQAATPAPAAAPAAADSTDTDELLKSLGM
jgi:chemotaxis protein CheX